METKLAEAETYIQKTIDVWQAIEGAPPTSETRPQPEHSTLPHSDIPSTSANPHPAEPVLKTPFGDSTKENTISNNTADGTK